jgi:ubiquinone/menaquinone biosynthesis C-methylase UbiE
VAPIENPTAILEVGAGSGRWAIEVAEEYKNAMVTGIDLSPVSPTSAVPQNCKFVIADLTKGLDFETGSLDLVHSRYFGYLPA